MPGSGRGPGRWPVRWPRGASAPAIAMKNCPEYLTAFYGAWILGAAVVPVNAKLHAREIAYILENSGAGVVFTNPGIETGGGVTEIDVTGPEFAAMQAGGAMAVADRDPGDLAWLFYTSGTTGQPKGVRITHGMLRDMSLAYFADVDSVGFGEATLYSGPMSHAAGIYNMLFTLRGGRHVCPVAILFSGTPINGTTT